MSIETTHRISRKDAISTLEKHRREVFQDDCNDRLSYELYQIRRSEFENYEVVDFEEDDQPKDDIWPYWTFGW